MKGITEAVWFDAHMHWQAEVWAGDRDPAAERAQAAGVSGWCSCGTRPADWSAVAAGARVLPGTVAAYGLHPWYLKEKQSDWLERLRAQLVAERAAAVGEIGLDHTLPEHDPSEQTEIFRVQFALARELDRVAVLHCRRAWETLLDVLRVQAAPKRGFVLHAYSGGAELVKELSRLGAWFSFSGSIAMPGNRRGAAALQAVPPDRLLLETDAPYLLPTFMQARGHGRNEPSFLPEYGMVAARILDCTPKVLADLTLGNACRLFGVNVGSWKRKP